MADYFTTNYVATPLLTPEDGAVAPAGRGHSRLRIANGHLTNTVAGLGGMTPADGDVLRICDIPSYARVGHVYVNSDGAQHATDWTIELGLYKKGNANDGAVIDSDLFNATLELGAAADHVDQFALAVLNPEDRWKLLWELATLGAATYTEDPKEMWTLCAEFTEAGTASVAGDINFEILYVAGD